MLSEGKLERDRLAPTPPSIICCSPELAVQRERGRELLGLQKML